MSRLQINNRPDLKESRKLLRRNLTPAEASLWKCLQKSQLEGRKFRRQHSIGAFVVDFYCPSEKLVIELDGYHHFTPEYEEYDLKRTEYMNSLGIKVLRFENRLVFQNLEEVLNVIKNGLVKEATIPKTEKE
jgi:very-short-patch-repair endonuclease